MFQSFSMASMFSYSPAGYLKKTRSAGKGRRGNSLSRATNRVVAELLESRRMLSASLAFESDPGPGSFPIDNLTSVDRQLFFTIGGSLYSSDGSTAGTTRIVQDIPIRTNPDNAQNLANIGGTLYFSGVQVTPFGNFPVAQGVGLWTSDGTLSGTQLLKITSSNEFAAPVSEITSVGQQIFFTANGSELWKTNGTPAGTTLIEVVTPNPGLTITGPSDFTAVNGKLFFAANRNRDTFTSELWVSDGTAAGTMPIRAFGYDVLSPGPSNFVNLNGTVYFTAVGSGVFPDLWKSDGTTAGTVMVKDIAPGVGSAPLQLTALGNKLIFTAQGPGPASNREVWITDGTDAGTQLLKDINFNGSSNASDFTLFNGNLYFVANDGVSGAELWRTNGTNVGTFRVADINDGFASATPQNFVAVGDRLFFTADDGIRGGELWETNGTQAGTAIVTDINPDIASSSPSQLTAHDGSLFLIANDGVNGAEVWKADANVTPPPPPPPVPDTTPPGPVTSLSATPADGSVFLSWSNAFDATGTLIVRRANQPPTVAPVVGQSYTTGQSLGDGTVVLVASGDSLLDGSLVNDTAYHYAAYAYDAALNYASAVQTNATPSAVISPEPPLQDTIERGDETFTVSILHYGGGPVVNTARTWLLIHGRADDHESFIPLASEIASRTGDQVLLLDWSGAAAANYVELNFFDGQDSISTVADWAATTLLGRGLNGGNLNLIGHSWGSYVADEIAENFLAKQQTVKSIVALDPAKDASGQLGFQSTYDPETAVDFGSHAETSWSFYSADDEPIFLDIPLEPNLESFGNPITAATARESFVVYGTRHVHGDNGGIVALFENILVASDSLTSEWRYFSLDRLVNGASGPWKPDQFRAEIVTPFEYEAEIYASNLTTPTDIVFVQRGTTIQNGSGILVTDEGDAFRVTVTGNAIVELIRDPADEEGLYSLVITGANLRTGVVFESIGGLGIPRIKDILVDGSIKLIIAPELDLRGGLRITGTIKHLHLRDVQDDHLISIGPASDPRSKVIITLAKVRNLNIVSATPISSITVDEWIDDDATPDSIEAPWLHNLSVAGDFGADIKLSDPSAWVRRVNIGGAITRGIWDIAGGVKILHTGGAGEDWQVEVGGEVRKVEIAGDQLGSFSAGWIHQYGVGGDLRNGEIVAAEPGKTPGIRSLRVAGTVEHSTIKADGDIKWLRLGGVVDSTVPEPLSARLSRFSHRQIESELAWTPDRAITLIDQDDEWEVRPL